MKKTAIITASLVAGIICAVQPLHADQNAQSPTPVAVAPTPVPGPNVNGEYSPAPYPPAPVDRASHLIGMKVVNPHDDTLGTVTDVVFDLQSGRVSYVVVKRAHRSYGSYAFAAIPPSAFMNSQDLKHLILNTDRIRLSSYQDYSGKQYYSSTPAPVYSSTPPPVYNAPPQSGELHEVIIAPAEPAHETVTPEPSESQ